MRTAALYRLGALLLAALLVTRARAEVVFSDNFDQFPAGTTLTQTNYPLSLPNRGMSAAFQTNGVTGQNSTTVETVSESGGTAVLFDLGSAPYRADYVGNPLTGALTGEVLTLSFTLSVPVTFNPSRLGGFGIVLPTTNLDIFCGQFGCVTNGMPTNPLILINDGGQVFTFTNTAAPDTAVLIGNWGALVGTVMTNVLVLDYPAGTFSYSINGTVLTNLPLPGFVGDIFPGVQLAVLENFTNINAASFGNQFTLDDVRLDREVIYVGADVLFYIAAAKGERFGQFDTNEPVALPTRGNLFLSSVTPALSNVIRSVGLRLPGSRTNLVVRSDPQDDVYRLLDAFDTVGALDTAYPDGVYKQFIVAVNDGTNKPAFNLAGDQYPNSPHLLNAQAIDPTANWELAWDPFDDGTPDDFIQVSLDNGYQSPDFGQPDALTGLDTSFLIPSNTLVAGHAYCATLLFMKVVEGDDTTYPGVPGGVGYFGQTTFNITTTGLTNAVDLAVTLTAEPNPVLVNSNLIFTIVVTNQGPLTATGVTLSDTLASNLVYVSDSAGGHTNGQNFVATIGTLASGASTTLTITAKVTAPGATCNTAHIQANETDYNPCNNDSEPVCTTGEAHDFAVTAIKPKKRIVLTARKPSRPTLVRVTIQNRSPQPETITEAAFSNLVTLVLTSLHPASPCPAPVASLHVGRPQRRLPVTLKPKQKLTVVFDVTFDCATDPLQTRRRENHDDFSYTATVHHEAIDGKPDTDPYDDVCPHGPLPYPGNIDPYPNGTIRDRGCGGRNPDHTFGGPVTTDVVVHH